MTQVAAPPQPRRRWAVRWLKRLAIGFLALVAVSVGFVLWLNHRSSQSLADAIAETNLVDPAWRIADLEAARTAVADDQNAALRILELVARMPAGNIDAISILGDTPANRTLSPEHRQNLTQLLNPLTELLRDARDLSEYTTGRFPITYSPGFLGTKLRSDEIDRARDLVIADLMDRIESADAAGAVRSWQAFCVVGEAIGDEPVYISQLKRTITRRMALDWLERLLSQFQLEENALVQIQTVLERDEPQQLALNALRGERAGSFEIIESLIANAGQRSSWSMWSSAAQNMTSGRTTMSEALALVPGSLPGQQAAYLRFMNRAVAVVRQPPEAWSPQLSALNADVGNLPALVRMLVPAVVKMGDVFQRSHAEMRCAIASVAAERFRRTNGRWPDKLQDLVNAGLLTAVPLDPFDGESLRLKRTDYGLVVYSIGADGVDDGGDVTRQSSGPQSKDIGVRLWDLNKRKLPPVGQP